jgi:hypothetical protein
MRKKEKQQGLEPGLIKKVDRAKDVENVSLDVAKTRLNCSWRSSFGSFNQGWYATTTLQVPAPDIQPTTAGRIR